MLSLGRLVTGEAVALAQSASRLVEQGDALVRDQMARGLEGRALGRLAASMQRQHALMAALSGNAITAVRLATRHLAPALERVQAIAHPEDRAGDDEKAAHRLLRALGELERSIREAERRMHDAGASIARVAERAGRHDAAAVCASLIRRLARRDPH